jgi:predicted GNAT family acetyltransferase
MPMDTGELAIIHEPQARQFVARLDGHRAVLQYEPAAGVMTITHTRVPEAIRSRGVAAALTRAALELARAASWKVRPECLYALAFLRAHADYADLLAASTVDPSAVNPSAVNPSPVNDTQRRHVDELLDEALEESFPASDVPAIGGFRG